ncbi:hypothetical protein B0H16DRAFT_748713 [Mycena metata]|uniref:Heterokaryon incompatibility domain-containing protein n=1 Tax=Mycena metata TaxID=1033252 RepID=A0AAD7J0P6_9AGAR|nr:hypothetical protein B0H16DRAFT_748713 [Mycena metata]
MLETCGGIICEPVEVAAQTPSSMTHAVGFQYWSTFFSNIQPRRLFLEEEGVEGCGLFHRRVEENRAMHVLGNIGRLCTAFATAPILLLTPRPVVNAIENYVQSPGVPMTQDVLDAHSPYRRTEQYEVAEFRPSWVLEVNGELRSFRQITFSNVVEQAGYIALSYPMRSAVVLAEEAGLVAAPPPPGREYSLSDRRTISGYLLRLFLQLYCSGGKGHRTFFLWMDEFCLSDDNLPPDEDVVSAQRSTELGRLADIFRRAAQVVVFCHETDCDHTGLSCAWGRDLFTLPAIIHAKAVLQLTRKCERDNVMAAQLVPVPARKFREKVQINAERGEIWHLHALFQHTDNVSAAVWDVVIPALVAEAIRRDEACGSRDHKFLGKVVNGLPRRARLADLGNGGWRDLAWLLQVNQELYNAAGLAAICSLADSGEEGVEWLGRPIAPLPGNERLKPLAVGFQLCSESGVLLAINDSQIVKFGTLKRDPNGLYTNEDMQGIKNLTWTTAATFIIISALLWLSGQYTASKIVYITTAILYRSVELLAGTVHLDRTGWVCLEDAASGNEIETRLGEFDPTLRTMTNWGDRQLAPRWLPPRRRPYYNAKLVDLRRKVYVDTIVVSRPTSMVLLAFHGSGVTAMLLGPPADPNRRTGAATKAGMCNLPPYILTNAKRSDMIYVGNTACVQSLPPSASKLAQSRPSL